MTSKTFKENGYCVVKNFIPKELALFLSDYLQVKKGIKILNREETFDEQIPDAICVYNNDPALESLYLSYSKKVSGNHWNKCNTNLYLCKNL